MIPIPAIDLKEGRVVRLLQGRFDAEKVYGESPEAVAKAFENEGASRIHVVDLDGALKGEPKNIKHIEQILRAVKAPLQVGGGIRELEKAALYLGLGARWVILGTQACLDPGFLKEALHEFGDKVIVGIDAKDGRVAVEGWTKVLPKKAIDLALDVERFGGKTIIYTDIAKDGVLAGPNFVQIEEMAGAVKTQVIASGGIGSLDDVKRLSQSKNKNIIGTIIGKALYEKKFTLSEAIKACSQNA